jgi:phenylalanyl-tRNA synthetase beta chain
MKLSINWLRELVNPKVNNREIVEQLTMAGLEVEGIQQACMPFEKVFTAKIIKVEQHPDADKLKVCTVRLPNEDLNIVCGDPTVTEGKVVALATIGASLKSGEFKIKRSKLRGVESQGMLCSEFELGLADTSNGIWVLPANTELGLDLYEFLQLKDEVIEVSLTPNRGDCFSVRGLARELAVLNNLTYDCADDDVAMAMETGTSNTDLKLNITIDNSTSCPRYAGRVIKNLNAHAVTPFWMKEKLRRSGVRCLYPLVDVTNYVMLELGQPMHAFDLEHITGGITVRSAYHNEKLQLLDGTELTLTTDNLVIADETEALALAGVMGGSNSAITKETTDIFLESAFFTTESTAKTARQFNRVTDSSQRFERGVDPSITVLALKRATQLLLEIASTSSTIIGEITEVCNSNFSNFTTITLREHRIKRVLGIALDSNTIENILTRLGLKLLDKTTVASDVIYKWQVPTHRFDLTLEEDLLEELARVYGYNNIPNNAPKRALDIKPLQAKTSLAQKIRTGLAGRGYFEALTYSFIDSHLQADFAPNQTALKLINPISSEMSELRLSLCPGLIKAAEYNYNHQVEHIKLYEIGKCFYLQQDGSVQEKNKLAGILVGKRTKENWDHKTEKFDFYDAKGDLEVLFSELGLQNIQFNTFASDKVLPGLHPGRSALITSDSKELGWVAVVHPGVNKKIKIDDAIILFELSLEELQIPSYTKYKEVSKFPQIRRDLAFLFKNDIKVQNLYDIVTNVAGDLLKKVYIFDVYQGKGIPDGYKSVAFAIILQHQAKTLVDEEITKIMNSVIDAVSQQLGGKLRE